VVLAGGLAVHVVGTVFAVSQAPQGTEVAVGEGRIRVDLPDGQQAYLGAGQRLRVDARGRVQSRLPLTPAFRRELEEVSAVADTTAAVETRAVQGAVGGAPSAPPLVASPAPASRTLPRLDPRQARARQGTLPPEATAGLPAEALAPMPASQRLEPRTEVEVEEPGTTWPSMAGVPGTRVAPPVAAEPAPPIVLVEAPPAGPADQEAWARLPQPAPPESQGPPPTPVRGPAAARGRPLATDLESRFMDHAETAVEKGDCERYQPGLEDIAQDGVRTSRTELARVLRARCYGQLLRPRQALSEYRKYLQEYPAGRFVLEAREALGP